MDANDSLGHFRNRFVVTDRDLIYLDGNSLGRMPTAVRDLVTDVTDRQWSDRLIRSWNEGWWDLQLDLGDLLAPVIGAGPGEVIISDSTSVNLYKLALAAIRARPGRSKIVTDDLNFPTDLYVLEGIAHSEGLELEIVGSDGVLGPVGALTDAIDDNTALVSLSHTVFKSGYTYKLETMSGVAHQAGALVLWDCSHSVGSVPIDLNAAGADLAIGCTYKYLSGGPGSPAFLFVKRDLQEELENPITAWWGHAEPFAFDLHYRPVQGIRRFHTGTMPILSLAATEAGIRDVAQAGIEAIRAKSLALTEFFMEMSKQHLEPWGFHLASPLEPDFRGSHVSLGHSEAWPITRALIEVANVIPDFRVPDNIRFGFSPLYTGFVETHTAVHRLRQIAETKAYLPYLDVRATVT